MGAGETADRPSQRPRARAAGGRLSGPGSARRRERRTVIGRKRRTGNSPGDTAVRDTPASSKMCDIRPTSLVARPRRSHQTRVDGRRRQEIGAELLRLSTAVHSRVSASRPGDRRAVAAAGATIVRGGLYSRVPPVTALQGNRRRTSWQSCRRRGEAGLPVRDGS